MTAAIGLALCVMGALGTSSAATVGSARTELGGTWVYAGGAPEREARKEAVAETTRGMSFFIRGAARKRVESKTPIAEKLQYEFPGGFIQSWAQGAMTFHTPDDGSPVTVQVDREPVQVVQFLRDGSLVQTFTAKDGVRTNIMTPQRGGAELRAEIHLTSPRLPRPLTYVLTYRRQQPAGPAP